MLSHFPWNRLLLCGAIVPMLIFLWPHVSPHISMALTIQPLPKTYSIRILSYDPLIIYVVGFMSWGERNHLLRLGESLFERSTVYVDGETENQYNSDRTSSTAYLPDEDPIVQRIIRRASEIQGYTPPNMHESLQLTRYRIGQLFNPHLDPLDGYGNRTGTHRLTTIFAIVESTCEKCGTQFPNLSINWTTEDRSWCKYVDCDNNEALTVKAVPGNAVFWKSWDNEGKLDLRTTHAGLPPEGGIKTGLNIWTHG
ncbi:prolyl 4-hydroxylase alpha [Colletotrichum truncatum]|uniref:Prolyl 4-hydroxylase alpha n=1 Tax=Colletotrichum truncatum TaxID=5467 RepID=A0ACC3Z3A2_COLTU|nr:prolyl 4-hydroxylase alpha [Colletotrichum truncatum]KAF6793144.1 prolyl 4-hydroxylase alpha [Colletotrichum truncatum]